ncbi:protein phosphatase 1 regulatory subunit 1B-like isoform X2 [Betta splendens]|uniref:Protein phosphatase 1 regulatory subunit 1B n=1 Tax=Betta splendens TaxID=158456 RepID=A0A6P7L5I5_BETSP|nr:protein phosphatase 1 regulatory subunit 1B-like isoform X2 [Betta splendens]
MDPLLPGEADAMEAEEDKDAKRKIQFSVPSSVPLQLDPRQVEMIRRRRPTPATLFRLTDPPSPEEDSGPQQVDRFQTCRISQQTGWVLGENGALKAKLVHASTYQPPSLKAVQRMAQAHLSSLDMSSVDNEEPSSGEEEEGGVSESVKVQCAPPDSSTLSADLGLRCGDEEEAKEGGQRE